ncbi:molecular chaperone TorD family protein [Vibrio metschnikovii]|uniref:molecular chaperone TorD family protein n=1 Tax=Vibrio metschnikovii TaxID=28172 RepID=UPI001C30EF65|nr:molecular chaperone TorD family protein [Vibrio metschnikovii]EKO3565384.1 molecular chaperone TorD family protein [Vibrio metschnikovii]EKO3769591.1 molecular chaperone TorD family protein [Vibrio metschnikovii]
MNDIITLSSVLGSLLYYPLSHPKNQEILHQLIQWSEQPSHPFIDLLVALKKDTPEAILDDYQQLFEGRETMLAPPWGSVYLDKEQVIFGETTLTLRTFLRQHGLEIDTGLREPEDHFGLMLMLLSQLLGNDTSQKSVQLLLSHHLLPWSYRYLTLLKQSANTQAYQCLADIAEQWLEYLQQVFSVQAVVMKLYR